jgi:hypothetical protein
VEPVAALVDRLASEFEKLDAIPDWQTRLTKF